MFRRRTPEVTQPEPVVKPGGKGRPTPTRKEAEAAARERAKMSRDKKALARHQRAQRSESSRKMREAMKTGDERYLPGRDRGPVRRLARDVVDSRLTFGDVMLPVFLLVVLLSSGAFGTGPAGAASSLMPALILFLILDVVLIRRRVRKEVRKRFPDESLKGLGMYTIIRALNMRFLRLPKPQVKMGQPLSEHYR